MNEDDKRFITDAEALHLIKEGEYVHTFRSVNNILLGADISRIRLMQILEAFPDKIEIAGEAARSMGHGIAIVDDIGPLFIATDQGRLDIFDPPCES